ncbi:MAG: hypothetical protein WC659_05250 [Patescibacteria group bacterium]
MLTSAIQQFVAQLMTDAGLDALAPEFKEDYAEQLAAQVERRIGIKAVGMLDFKGKQEYLKFIEKFENKVPNPEEAHKFFQQHVTDFDTKMQTVLDDFSKEFLSSIKKD